MNIPDGEQTMWSTQEPEILEKLIARHQKVNAYLKSKKQKKGYMVLFLIDDWAYAGDNVVHSSTTVLASMYVRGRHSGCCCWLSAQKQKVLSSIIRTNLCWFLVWRPGNPKS